MNVLHVIVGLRAGGAERMLQRLIEANRCDPMLRHEVISLTELSSIGRTLQRGGICVRALDLRSIWGLPYAFLRLALHIRRSNPDIVQTWMYHADFLGGLAARTVSNCLIIWGVRTTDVPAGGFSTAALLRWLCARLSGWIPDKIVCAAEASRLSHASIGYCASKLLVIPNGFDFSGFAVSAQARSACRIQLGIAPDDVVIGTLGRLHPDKDFENFVRMAGILGRQFHRLRFLMGGRNLTSDSGQLARWIAESGIASRFILAGERSDVPLFLGAMDVFCLHSRNEGFPNVLAEAMAMALPCVTTDVGDAALLIGDTGLVVPKEDPAALAKAIRCLLQLDPQSRSAMGQRAKARVEAEFSIARTKVRFDTVYQQVLSDAAR